MNGPFQVDLIVTGILFVVFVITIGLFALRRHFLSKIDKEEKVALGYESYGSTGTDNNFEELRITPAYSHLPGNIHQHHSKDD